MGDGYAFYYTFPREPVFIGLLLRVFVAFALLLRELDARMFSPGYYYYCYCCLAW